MGDTWAAQWAASWAAEAQRFNPYHAKAGSSTGGQFASSGGGGGGAAKAPAGKTGAQPATDAHGPIAARQQKRAQLLAQARKDVERARELEKELHVLQQQERVAVAAAHKAAANATAAQKAAHQASAHAKAAANAGKKAAAHAAATAKAGHVIHHKHHTAAHHKHTHHAQTLKQRITSLQTEIHGLRQHAAALKKQAAAL